MEGKLKEALTNFFNWNPPPLTQDPDAEYLCPPLVLPPRAFYGLHLDQNLSVKHVRTMPSLLENISDRASKEIAALCARGGVLPDSNPGLPNIGGRRMDTKMADASEVSNFYGMSTGRCGIIIAATLIFCHRAPGWIYTLDWKEHGGPRVPPGRYIALEENYGPVVAGGPKAAFVIKPPASEILDDSARDLLRSLFDHFPVLAVWEVLRNSEVADKLIQDLGRTESFDQQKCTTGGFVSPKFTPTRSVDAITTPWTREPRAELPVPADNRPASAKPRRRSDRLNKLRKSGEPESLRNEFEKPAVQGRITAASPSVRCPQAGDPLSAEYMIHHAWSRAVSQDATFIVFQNGNFERIGVRDRATQTLYLSEVIEVQKCDSPGYGEIHTGLHMAIIRDALDRVGQLNKHVPDTVQPSNTSGTVAGSSERPSDQIDDGRSSRGQKREKITETAKDGNILQVQEAIQSSDASGSVAGSSKRPSDQIDDGRSRKRQKKEKTTETANIHQSAVDELGTRTLALLHLQYRFYNSSAPASFLRIGPCLAGPQTTSFRRPKLKASYKIRECITLTLISEIDTGATGVVHGAVLKVQLKTGGTLSMDVVVKIAILDYQRQKMSHEYSIYQHLARSNVKGIPEVYGLFEDVEGTATAMVMSRCSSNLWDLRPDPTELAISVSPPQRAQFLAILADIHRAGVRHRDLRPANLMFSTTGDAVIIDFDCAKLDLRKKSSKKEEEVENLLGVFDNEYVDHVESTLTASSHAESEDSSESEAE